MTYKCACEQNQRSSKRLKVATGDVSGGKGKFDGDDFNCNFYSCLSDQEVEHRLKNDDSSSSCDNDDDDDDEWNR
eukprot:CAMPEP_0196822566 /NCGR_PEP_ID=MMETSP1362-20130617/83937_1 /TAXON_ID=163516 /ORGANISM="Leptocylindrus danicus, Strain CCMP1856" /LENGTH=74 /DNA_ID=CAMNT_0042202153 /DNA_START=597 /DNA_END=821 /DNA_ORIENTATION=+